MGFIIDFRTKAPEDWRSIKDQRGKHGRGFEEAVGGHKQVLIASVGGGGKELRKRSWTNGRAKK